MPENQALAILLSRVTSRLKTFRVILQENGYSTKDICVALSQLFKVHFDDGCQDNQQEIIKRLIR